MLVIDKDAIHLEYFEDGNQVVVEIDHDQNTLTRYLNHTVYIEHGVTIRDLFLHLGQEAANMDIVFDAQMDGYSFIDFYEEAMEESITDSQLRNVTFYHHVDYVNGEVLGDVRVVVMGEHPKSDKVMIPYTMEYTSIKSYSHLPIVMDCTYRIIEEVTDEDELKVRMLFDGTKPMTAYELIGALLAEASYFGTPEMRSEVSKEVIDEIYQGAEVNDAYELEAIDPKVAIRRLEEELEEAVGREDYETSAEIRDKIKDLKRAIEK